jgi:hypothetical protein
MEEHKKYMLREREDRIKNTIIMIVVVKKENQCKS